MIFCKGLGLVILVVPASELLLKAFLGFLVESVVLAHYDLALLPFLLLQHVVNDPVEVGGQDPSSDEDQHDELFVFGLLLHFLQFLQQNGELVAVLLVLALDLLLYDILGVLEELLHFL